MVSTAMSKGRITYLDTLVWFWFGVAPSKVLLPVASVPKLAPNRGFAAIGCVLAKSPPRGAEGVVEDGGLTLMVGI